MLRSERNVSGANAHTQPKRAGRRGIFLRIFPMGCKWSVPFQRKTQGEATVVLGFYYYYYFFLLHLSFFVLPKKKKKVNFHSHLTVRPLSGLMMSRAFLFVPDEIKVSKKEKNGVQRFNVASQGTLWTD